MIREQSIRLPFEYAAGQAGSAFLAALRDDRRILGSKCSACQRVVCPAQAYCSRCGGAPTELVDVSPCGTLQSWTERAEGRSEPRCFGLVLLDGADTAFIHRLLARQGSWSVGARVRARFCEGRTGSILDIEGFLLTEDAAA